MKSFFKKTKKSGFTLIEVLVVMVIVGVIAGLILGSLSKYRFEQTLRVEALSIVSIINDARYKTLASLNSSQYGIHINNNSVVSFSGSSYNQNNQSNFVHTLPDGLEIVNISISGGSDIIFERLNGKTTNVGSFKLVVKNNNSKSRTINISATGLVSLN